MFQNSSKLASASKARAGKAMAVVLMLPCVAILPLAYWAWVVDNHIFCWVLLALLIPGVISVHRAAIMGNTELLRYLAFFWGFAMEWSAGIQTRASLYSVLSLALATKSDRVSRIRLLQWTICYCVLQIGGVIFDPTKTLERHFPELINIDHSGGLGVTLGIFGSTVPICALIVYLATLRIKDQASRSAKHDAEKRAQDRADFLAFICHELRNPLNGCYGTVQLMACDASLTSELKESVSIILETNQLMRALLDDVLDYSKLEAGKLAFEEVGFSITQSLQRTVMAFRSHVARDIAVDLRISDAIPAEVVGDPTRFNQIVWNVMSNAAKFTKKGSIVIHLRPEGDGEGGVETDGTKKSGRNKAWSPGLSLRHSVVPVMPGVGSTMLNSGGSDTPSGSITTGKGKNTLSQGDSSADATNSEWVCVVLTVKDTGIGVDPEILEQLFEPFSQAKLSVSRKYGGTGLGLSIVRQLATRMGGGASITSDGVGLGTEVRVGMRFKRSQQPLLTGERSSSGVLDRGFVRSTVTHSPPSSTVAAQLRNGLSSSASSTTVVIAPASQNGGRGENHQESMCSPPPPDVVQPFNWKGLSNMRRASALLSVDDAHRTSSSDTGTLSVPDVVSPGGGCENKSLPGVPLLLRTTPFVVAEAEEPTKLVTSLGVVEGSGGYAGGGGGGDVGGVGLSEEKETDELRAPSRTGGDGVVAAAVETPVAPPLSTPRLSSNSSSSSTAPPPRPLRVLVVDDLMMNLKVMKRILLRRPGGCEVTAVMDGFDAVRLLMPPRSSSSSLDAAAGGGVAAAEEEEEEVVVVATGGRRGGAGTTWYENDAKKNPPPLFDVVLMDIEMPGMRGTDATRLLRAAGVTVPIVAVSGNAGLEQRDEYREAGMDDFLAKPVEIGHLLKMVEHWSALGESRRACCVLVDHDDDAV